MRVLQFVFQDATHYFGVLLLLMICLSAAVGIARGLGGKRED